MSRTGKVNGTTKFIAFGGDGGTYDIGFQSLSGAMERGHDMVYVCYDNEAYMNTGIQRSSSTPKYADTTTSPAGSDIPGKVQFKKDLTMVMAAHNIPYVAQSAPFRNMRDLYEKAEKAIYTPGPAFLNVMAPCPRGWRYNTPQLMEVVRLAIDSCVWPLYEVIEGKFVLNYKPRKKIPVVDYLKENEGLLEELQQEVDRRWNRLLELCGEA
jgi:pyruvate ferredoxin oxidoreductase beta subunit